MEQIVIFTAIFGNYDKIREIRHKEDNVRYICFTDRKQMHSDTWEIIYISSQFKSRNLSAKIVKVLPHLFFSCDYSLWIDGSVEILGNMHELIDEYMNGEYDIALLKHRIRDCPYCEAEKVLLYKLEKSSIVKEQMQKYIFEGLPKHSGLNQGGIILRRHSKIMELFNLSWWAEICRYSHRDQLSLNYTLNKIGLNAQNFRFSLYEQNPYFYYHGHKNSISHLLLITRIAFKDRTIFNWRKIRKVFRKK